MPLAASFWLFSCWLLASSSILLAACLSVAWLLITKVPLAILMKQKQDFFAPTCD